MRWKQAAFELGSGDSVLLKTAATFDLYGGGSLLVEVQGSDQDASARSARFLADAMAKVHDTCKS